MTLNLKYVVFEGFTEEKLFPYCAWRQPKETNLTI